MNVMIMATIWISAALALSILVILLLLLRPTRYTAPGSAVPASVQILVLGDIDRSPRMRYHASSVARHGGQVQFIGFIDLELDEETKSQENITIVPLPSPPRILQTTNKLVFLAAAPVKVLLQIWSLWAVLAYRTKASKWMLVQNPPSIPTLLIATAVCYLRGTRLIIDWHNFGYSILGLKLGERHPLVRVSYVYEFMLGRLASCHLTVTDAMGHVLRSKLGSGRSIQTLHDRPARIFQPCDDQNRLRFLQQYGTISQHYNGITEGKAKILVSSTSWTPDEDFSIFLDALCQYSRAAVTSDPKLPELVVVITGKGPQQQQYTNLISKLSAQGLLEKIHIYTDWLSFQDYAHLLASADLGISLHTSSSGVDLPMKVVDMFGAGLPVLGWSNFSAWPELVTENVNGKGFRSADEMAAVLQDLLLPGNDRLLKLKAGALKESKRRWDDEWDPVMGKLLGLVK